MYVSKWDSKEGASKKRERMLMTIRLLTCSLPLFDDEGSDSHETLDVINIQIYIQ